MIALGGGFVGAILAWATVLLGISGVIAYALSGRIARFAKQRQALVRMLVWFALFPMISCLSFIMFNILLGGHISALSTLLFLMPLFFWFPDPSLFFPFPLISLAIWLLGVVLIARKNLAQAIQGFSRKKTEVQ